MEKYIQKALCIYIPFVVIISIVTFVFFDFSIDAVAGIYISNLVSATLYLVGIIILSIMSKEINELALKSPFANMFKKFEIGEIILSLIYGLATYFMIKNDIKPLNVLLYIIAQLVLAVILFSQFNAYPLERRFTNPKEYISRYN